MTQQDAMEKFKKCEKKVFEILKGHPNSVAQTKIKYNNIQKKLIFPKY